ncbi:hypothetical protein V6952_00145 [Rhizobium laguerreae]
MSGNACRNAISKACRDVLKVVRHELDLIRTMKYAPYFLTVFSTSAMRGHRAFLA